MIRVFQSLLASGLCREDLACLFFGDVIALQQAIDLNRLGYIDHHDLIGCLEQTAFDQKGHDQDNDRLGTGRLDVLVYLLPDQGMGDRFELLAGGRRVEDPLPKRPPVKCPIGLKDLRAKDLDDPSQPRCARLDDLPGNHIGIDDRNACLGQAIRDRGLAGGDATGQDDDSGPFQRWVVHFQ